MSVFGWTFSGPYVPAFGLNTEIYEVIFVNLGIQPECGKIRTRKTQNTNNFYAEVAYYFLLVYGAWAILTLLCVMLGAIIIYNQLRNSREEKSPISPPKIHIKEQIKVDSKSRRLTAAQTKQGQYEVCIQKVDKLLHNFVNDLIFGPVFQNLYGIVRQLKCVFVSTYFSFTLHKK